MRPLKLTTANYSEAVTVLKHASRDDTLDANILIGSENYWRLVTDKVIRGWTHGSPDKAGLDTCYTS